MAGNVYGRRPHRVSEKAVQEQVKAVLRTIGAKVYTLGRPPRRDAVHKGTGIGVGLPDLLVHLPARWTADPQRAGCAEHRCDAHQLWIEVKAHGGRLSPEQASFRDFCVLAGIPHIVGGVDAVIAYLLARGYLKPEGVPHYRLPKERAS